MVGYAEVETVEDASAAVPTSVTEYRVVPILTVQGRGAVLCMSRPECEDGDEG